MTKASESQPLLTAAEVREQEAAAMVDGTTASELMERAGRLAAKAIARFTAPSPVLVLCGPGNNGGDGYVIARRLRKAGWEVRVAALAAPATDTARAAAAAWQGPIERIGDATQPAPTFVDALFGIGVVRPIGDPTLLNIHRLAQGAQTRVAVDLPSGVSSDDGALVWMPVTADLTVSFGTLKPAHALYPAAAHMGRVVCADIGLPPKESSVTVIGKPVLPPVPMEAHKFTRGHVLVVGGEAAGAARLSACGALRAGAGYVTLLSPASTLAANAAHLTGVVLREADTPAAIAKAFADPRARALVIGPGLGTRHGRDKLLAALSAGKPVVLDADVFTLFAGDATALAAALQGPAVLTPHEGEFERMFGDIAGSKIDRAREAAARVGAVVVLKGPDTVVAAPDGRAAVSMHASPHLPTAGSGDVLSGIIAAMLVRGLPAFEAACAGVWLHGDAGRRGGVGLIAEDLPGLLPQVLADLA